MEEHLVQLDLLLRSWHHLGHLVQLNVGNANLAYIEYGSIWYGSAVLAVEDGGVLVQLHKCGILNVDKGYHVHQISPIKVKTRNW